MGAIVVTGSGRTGTSLMMQVLKGLGMDIVGFDYIPGEFFDRDLHPGGCWDLPILQTVNGIRAGEYDGQVIKLYGAQLLASDVAAIDRVIVCRRNKAAACESAVKTFRVEHPGVGFDTEEFVNRMYDANYSKIDEFLEKHRGASLAVWLEKMRENPVSQIDVVSCFVRGHRLSDDERGTVSSVVMGGVSCLGHQQ